jgi:hypothetical protein
MMFSNIHSFIDKRIADRWIFAVAYSYPCSCKLKFVYYICHRSLKRINLPFITPATPFTPGAVESNPGSLSPRSDDQRGKVQRNSLCFRSTLEMFDTANCMLPPLITRGWFSSTGDWGENNTG